MSSSEDWNEIADYLRGEVECGNITDYYNPVVTLCERMARRELVDRSTLIQVKDELSVALNENTRLKSELERRRHNPLVSGLEAEQKLTTENERLRLRVAELENIVDAADELRNTITSTDDGGEALSDFDAAMGKF